MIRTGTQTDIGREQGEREQQEKEEAAKKKKGESANINIKYFPPTPVYDPSFKEDTLPLFDTLIPTPEQEKQAEKKEAKEQQKVDKEQKPIDYYLPSPQYVPS